MKFIDLFSGAGFGAHGAVRGGGKPILAVDAWELATLTYKDNFPEARVITDLLENVDPYKLGSKLSPDVLLTSPECTAHSIARGAKPGSEKSRESALGISDWIRATSPRWVIVENVNRMKKWDRHHELVDAIGAEGYVVSDLHLNASDFGSAQARKRMFLICSQEGHRVSAEQLRQQTRRKAKVAKDIIDMSGKYASRPLYAPNRAKPTLERAERAIAKLGKGKPFLIVYYGSDYAGGWQSIEAPLRTITTLDRFGLVTWKGGEPYLRMLQPDELRQGMGATASLKLNYGSRREKVKLCGNGVCSDVMEVIFRYMAKVENQKKVRGKAA